MNGIDRTSVATEELGNFSDDATCTSLKPLELEGVNEEGELWL